MKLRNFFPLIVIAGSLTAQEAAEPVPPAGDSEKAPPRALIIEEDDEGAGLAPAEAPESDSSAPIATEDQAAAQQATPAGDMEDDGEFVADSETPAVKKEVNKGIQIQVEKFSSSPGVTQDSSEVSVTSPWRAKPLDTPPLGWKYIPAPSGVDPYRTTVKLGGDRSVNLAITPYVLVPASDGRNVIRILEPGYQPDQDHAVNDTIGSILQQSTAEIEDNEKRAAQAIQRLQRLLSSLPQP